MKLFRNPYVVAGLAVVAVGLVFYQMMPHMKWLRRTKSAKAPVPVAQTASAVTPPIAAPAPRPASPVVPPPAELSQADLSTPSLHPFALELLVLQRDSERWAAAPAKDPFKVRFYTTRSTNALPATQVLTLGGIWHQQQSSLVVINNKVLAQGNEILGYMITKIDSEGVWVEGQNGSEFVGFKTTARAADDSATDLPVAPTTAVNGGNFNPTNRNLSL